ncbi:MAG: YceD family protein [Gammaproteobacteria bacterium]|nr:YceD family protein [Gammaproteobacteria bacterium]
MLSLLPDFADPVRLCALGKAYDGEVALADLPRLAPLLTSPEGQAAFVLAFDMDAERRPVVAVDVKARLALRCQRCLQTMYLDVDASSRLAVVSGPVEAERLPDELDPLLVENDRLELRSLIEDELILAVPPAPMHPPEACDARLNTWNDSIADDAIKSADAKENPFAALAKLKSDADSHD